MGDWVRGRPGVSNAKAIRDALDALQGREIIVPVWSEASGQGSNLHYRLAGFARVQLTGYRLPGQNRISAIYLGPAVCGGAVPAPVTIRYTYDGLYRLTGADYLTGEFFHYTYDAAGNHLVGIEHISTTITTSYTH